jgi:hypothetical protein
MVFRVYGVVILWGLEGRGEVMIPFYCCFRPQEVTCGASHYKFSSNFIFQKKRKKEITITVFRHLRAIIL